MLCERPDRDLTAAEARELARLHAQIEYDPDDARTWQHCRRLIGALRAVGDHSAARGSA